MAPPLSVLLPVYNAEPFLDESLVSIRKQTFTDFELVVVDDGSTDASPETIRRHAAADPRVVVVTRPNGGHVAALNTGLGHCRGRFIARMDADDIALPKRFEQQMAFLAEHSEVDLVGAWVESIDAEGRTLRRLESPTAHEAIVETIAETGACIVAHPTWLARRAFFDRVGLYEETYRGVEDAAMLLLNAGRCRYAVMDEVLLKYRQHAGSVTARRSHARFRAAEAVVREFRRRGGSVRRVAQTRHCYNASWSASDLGRHSRALGYALRGLATAPWCELGYRALARCVWSALRGVRLSEEPRS